jgi:hypothetical protein
MVGCVGWTKWDAPKRLKVLAKNLQQFFRGETWDIKKTTIKTPEVMSHEHA